MRRKLCLYSEASVLLVGAGEVAALADRGKRDEARSYEATLEELRDPGGFADVRRTPGDPGDLGRVGQNGGDVLLGT